MLSKKIIRIFLFFLPTAPLFCIAQTTRIDSLKKKIPALTNQQQKLAAVFSLCEEQSSLNPDTLYQYAVTAKKMAISQKNPLQVAMADYYIAVQFSTRGLTDSCLAIANRYLQKLTYTAAEKTAYVDFTLLKARALDHSSKSKAGLEILYALLLETEKQGDTLTQIRTINGMAAAFVSLRDDKEAQKWCKKAQEIRASPLPLLLYQEACAVTMSNTSLTYLHLYEQDHIKKNLDSAAFYTDKAIAINREYEFLGGLAYSLGLKGTMLGYNGKPAEGEKMLKESLAIYQRIGNIFYVINAMSVMGNFYGVTNQPQKGIAICKEGIELSHQSHLNIYLYMNLAGNYKLAGDYRQYGETMEKLSAIKDSLHLVNSAAALSEVKNRYEMQKKETTIIEQNYALSRKNYIVYGSFALLFLGAAFSFILFRENKRKQHLKMQLLQEEEKRRSEIAISTAEEKERNRIAAELHDNLGSQLSYISSNMDFILDAPALLTDVQKKTHLGKINDAAKSTIADLRESIWALKKQQVDIDELADKIKLYAQNQLSHQAGMQLEVRETILHKTILSSAEALNIFRICQEAIHNASKHSAAGKITLSIENKDDTAYFISISDDGKGFDTAGSFDDHYGLENIYQRAKDIQAILHINSSKNAGTSVTLEKKSAL